LSILPAPRSTSLPFPLGRGLRSSRSLLFLSFYCSFSDGQLRYSLSHARPMECSPKHTALLLADSNAPKWRRMRSRQQNKPRKKRVFVSNKLEVLTKQSITGVVGQTSIRQRRISKPIPCHRAQGVSLMSLVTTCKAGNSEVPTSPCWYSHPLSLSGFAEARMPGLAGMQRGAELIVEDAPALLAARALGR